MGNSKSHMKQRKEQAHQEQDKEQVGKQADGEDGQEQIQGGDQEQSSEVVDDFSSFIKRNTNDLVYIMRTQYGLLDELVSNNVLTAKEVSLIQEKHTLTEEVRQLLEEITRESISDKTKESFLQALDKTQQKHVSNLIRGKGERATEYGDHWPLFYCSEYRRMIANRVKFIELVDAKNGLLDDMLSADCINYQQKQLVETGATDESQNTMLYDIVLWGSLAAYNSFINCLLLTNQHQVVFLLAPSVVGDMRPLNDDQQHRLKRNYSTLIRLINSKDGLPAELLVTDCITWLQKEYIESATRQSESNKRLIDVVRRGSEVNFHKFIECLDKTGQHHVSRVLIEDGAVAYMVAAIRPANNREQQERRIVDQLTALIRSIPDERKEELMNEALAEARQPVDQLSEYDVTILTAEIGHSIGLFFFTTSLRGLQYLYEIYSNEQLKLMMQKIFIVLCKTDDKDHTDLPHHADVDLRVDTLRWNPSNYADCVQQMCTLTNLPILSHVYEMARHNERLVATCDDVRSLPIDQFPFELIEMILVRTTAYLFITISRRTPRTEVYTLVTMTAVSLLWWEALSYRKYIKRLLKRYFKRVCHPFTSSPRQLTSLHIEGGDDVDGVAVSKNELFVACGGSNRIQVFESRPPFTRQEDIHVEELDNAIDNAVCNKSSLLYIADMGTQCAIWRVNLLAIKQIDKFVEMQWRPWSISVSNSRLLVTPLDGASLYIYGNGGNELHHIELPPYMDALHAVETAHKTCLVSHGKKLLGSTSERESVSEVDVNGRVIRLFNDDIDPIQFNGSRYMVLDNDHVIIADRYNDRIILLTSDLQFKRILIDSLHGERPYRLCLTPSRLLVVIYWGSTDIDIFQV